MNNKKFGVFIGRFQPFHNSHFAIAKYALQKVDKLIFVIGSATNSKSIKNPWTSRERIQMISSCFSKDDLSRINFIEVHDYMYNDNQWIVELQEKILNITKSNNNITLFGHKKDKSTFYLNLFPQWNYFEMGSHWETPDATTVRENYFSCELESIAKYVPLPVFEKLKTDMLSYNNELNENFVELQKEYQFIENYKNLWSQSPYPPTFVTVDTVVIKSGHVLLIKRKSHPGKGLLALPGGFIGQDEKIVNAAIRELKEETKIKLSKSFLESKIVSNHVFDHPGRSLRGRTITHAFCIDLGSGELPKVKGSDDAEYASWIPLRDIHRNEENFYEDHYYITSYFVNKF